MCVVAGFDDRLAGHFDIGRIGIELEYLGPQPGKFGMVAASCTSMPKTGIVSPLVVPQFEIPKDSPDVPRV